MTVTYSSDVATVGSFPSCFLRVLKRWRGSVYKLVYQDLLIFLTAFYVIALTYRFVLSAKQQNVFTDVAVYFAQYNRVIPLPFVMGFYISIIISRWSNQLLNVPWPDPLAVIVSSLVCGQDERGRKMRRTVMRYVCLSQIMTFRLISPRALKRFPTYDHLVRAGFLNENEKRIIQTMDQAFPKHPKYWMPIIWASSILTRARREGRVRDDFALRALNDELNKFRHASIVMFHYYTISVPLVYTQTVTLVVYLYFACSLIGQQWTFGESFNTINQYFPAFLILEFIFYMGWLKVAESLINPYGEDDDDFEINSWIDRNLLVSYLIVDEMHLSHPELIRDQYWDHMAADLPMTDDMPLHSTAILEAKEKASEQPNREESNVSLIAVLSEHSDMEINAMEPSSTDDLKKTDEQTVVQTVEQIDDPFASVPETAFEDLMERRIRERAIRRRLKIHQGVKNISMSSAKLGSMAVLRQNGVELEAIQWTDKEASDPTSTQEQNRESRNSKDNEKQ